MIALKTFLLTWLLLFCLGSAYCQKQVDPDAHVLLDQKAPLFTGQTLDGKDFSLSGNEGKIIVLQFWSFTCGVCYKEIPELNAIAKLYADKNVVVIGLLQESKEEALQKSLCRMVSISSKRKLLIMTR